MAKTKETAKEGGFGDNIRMDGLATKLMGIAGGIGVIGLGASFGLGYTSDKSQFMHSYLTAYAWILSIGLGALWWVVLQHLVNAKWSTVVRRVGELLASTMPVLALLSLPIVIPALMGDSTLYIWADSQKMHADHLLHKKAAFLNRDFFVVRLVIYFVFWGVLSRYLLSKSVEQDKTGAPEIRSKLQGLCAPSMILLALTLTFAAIDFVMTLEPKWYSTIFGVYYFAGAVVSFHSFFALALMWLQKNGRLAKSVTSEHYHDIGKMMFAFTAFWAYIAFSQFMLIWYANIPEETEWYHVRAHGAWGTVSYLMVAVNFLIPFFGLLSRHVKRNRMALGFWAVWILVVHWLDMFWLVKPHMHTEHLPFSILDVTCTVGMLGLFIAAAAFASQKVNLVPIKDPRLEKSLAFENF
ncbi:MAG: hypothetical protein L6Q84_03790 [Polyangiaceae bacterium]|nr:hypothetical protein [Polyangiaceae bacterium]